MAETTIREFLVALGFKTDEASHRRFVENIETATKRVVELGTAVEAMALGVLAATKRAAEGFENLYYASQRTGSSVKDIQAFRYAVSQLGGSSEEAQASLEKLASNLRRMPGFAAQLRAFGIDPNQGSVKILEDVVARLRRMPMWQAINWAEHFGIDENTLRALMLYYDIFEKLVTQRNEKLKTLGLDPDQAAKDATKFQQIWRDLLDTVSAIGQKIFSSLLPTRAANSRILMPSCLTTARRYRMPS
jgi:hypothetical protein